jgi:hypothetical protein
MRIGRIRRIERIVPPGASVCPPRPKKELLLDRHPRALAPHGAIRMIRSIRPIRIKRPFLMRPWRGAVQTLVAACRSRLGRVT